MSPDESAHGCSRDCFDSESQLVRVSNPTTASADEIRERIGSDRPVAVRRAAGVNGNDAETGDQFAAVTA